MSKPELPTWLFKFTGKKTAQHLFFDLNITDQNTLSNFSPDELHENSLKAFEAKSQFVTYKMGLKTFVDLIERAKIEDWLERKRMDSIYKSKMKKFGKEEFLFKDENDFYLWYKSNHKFVIIVRRNNLKLLS